VGDLLQLPSKTGALSWKTTEAWSERNKDRSYVTHYEGTAEFFARWNDRLVPGGQVYVVEPQGALSVDPEAFGSR
jgi:hypothetical protein